MKRKDGAKLFHEIKKFYPGFDSDELTKENLYQKIYPGKKYNDEIMRKLLSEMFKVSEEYLAYTNYKRDPEVMMKHLLNEIAHRNLPALFERTLKLSNDILEKNYVRDETYFFKKYELEKERKLFYAKDKSKLDEITWQPMMDNLISYTLTAVAKYYGVMINDMRFEKVSYNFDFMDPVMKFIEKSNFIDQPVISIYYYILKSLLEKDDLDHYYRLKELMKKYGNLLERGSEGSIYIYLQNYCYVKADEGIREFTQERFYIQYAMLEKNLCFTGNYIHKDFFSGIIIIALGLKKFEWTEKFIEEYKDRLNPETRSNTLNFNYAELHFYKKNYEKALEYLSEVMFDDFYDKVMVKALTLMIYYESNALESAMSLIDSFKHFLSTFKYISPYVKDRTNNFLNFTIKLIRLQNGETGLTKEELRNEVLKTKSLMQRIWLLEQTKCQKSEVRR